MRKTASIKRFSNSCSPILLAADINWRKSSSSRLQLNRSMRCFRLCCAFRFFCHYRIARTTDPSKISSGIPKSANFAPSIHFNTISISCTLQGLMNWTFVRHHKSRFTYRRLKLIDILIHRDRKFCVNRNLRDAPSHFLQSVLKK